MAKNIGPNEIILAAFNKVPASKKPQARKIAKHTYYKFLKQFNSWGDVPRSEARLWAAEAAAAEVLYVLS
tara:strand:+ start:366 stop:575 length:210 start_codon:yes stop_codon:yes gene_type:complete